MQISPQLNIAVQFNANSKTHVYVALFVFYVTRYVVMTRQTVCTYLAFCKPSDPEVLQTCLHF